MDNELMLDVGQANELKLAFRRAGYTNADIKKISEGDVLAQVLPIVRGNAEVRHIIDCDAPPRIPFEGWSVEKHRKGGQLEWNPKTSLLYLSKSQQEGKKVVEGHKLRKELTNKPVLNTNVFWYLLGNPHLIPEDWKQDKNGNTRYTFFWGTIYRDAHGNLTVLCLYWNSDAWDWNDHCLDGDWDLDEPAALRASSEH